MLPFEDPCKGCLVKPICDQMCPIVIEYYTSRIIKRSKQEVEAATGYYWEDDYNDENGFTHYGCAYDQIDREEKEKLFIPLKVKVGIIEKFMNYIKKGIMLCLIMKNKNTLKD